MHTSDHLHLLAGTEANVIAVHILHAHTHRV